MSLSFDHVTQLRVQISGVLDIGENQHGEYRRVVPIIGGHFEGPRLNGKILPHGADWNFTRPDGNQEIWARYTLETDDGALIIITNPGIRRLPEGIGEIEAITPGVVKEWYYRTTPSFETSDPRYRWMTQSVFVGSLLPPVIENQVLVDVYELL